MVLVMWLLMHHAAGVGTTTMHNRLLCGMIILSRRMHGNLVLVCIEGAGTHSGKVLAGAALEALLVELWVVLRRCLSPEGGERWLRRVFLTWRVQSISLKW